MSVLVVGSFMTDLVARTVKTPLPGQTVTGTEFNVFLGGKGANQAVSSNRCGSQTFLLGAVGNDDFGTMFINFFNSENFQVKYILKKDNVSTGIGHIVINELTGENQIIIIQGANLEYTVNELVENEKLFEKANVIVNQLEMADDIIFKSKELAKKHNKLYLLNPAPFKLLPIDFLRGIDFLTPNETELASFVNVDKFDNLTDIKNAARQLIKIGVRNVIVTLGDKGALHCDDKDCVLYEPYKVENVVDTVGAGDSFNGCLAAMLDQGYSISDSIKYANVSGALSITKHGAIPSIPSIAEIKKHILNNK